MYSSGYREYVCLITFAVLRDMQRKKVIGLSLDDVLIERIDQIRGLVKRSTFVNDWLKKSFSAGAKSDQERCP